MQSMQTRFFALALGLFYLLIGILGLIPALYTTPPADAPSVSVTAGYGLLFGQFPVNAVHDIVNVVIGLLGIGAGARFGSARFFNMTMFLLLGVAACFGFIPTLNTLGGILPMWSPDTWVHMASAILAGFFGYVVPESTHVEPAVVHAH